MTADITQGTATGIGGPLEVPAYAAATRGRRIVNSTRRTKCDDRNRDRWKVMLSVRGRDERARLKNDAFPKGTASAAPIAIDMVHSPTNTG